MHLLERTPLPASRLAEASALSVQEAMRHLARMQRGGLVQRTMGRAYVLSPLGLLVARRLPFYEGLFQEADFVNAHHLETLPTHLSLAPLLAAARVREGEPAHLAALGAHVRDARHLTLLGDPGLLGRALDSSGPGLAAEPCRVVIAADGEAATRSLLARLPPGAAVHVATPAALPVHLAASETGTLALLQDRQGHVDTSVLLRSTDPEFAAWAEALYHHLAASAAGARLPGLVSA